MTLYVEVALPLPINQTFTYRVPELWQKRTKAGVRILVPFGRRTLTGFAIKLRKRWVEKGVKPKDILEVFDDQPLFTSHFLLYIKTGISPELLHSDNL